MKNTIQKLLIIIIALFLSIVSAKYEGSETASKKFAEFNVTIPYTTATCWDCFDARGRMCSYMDGSSMVAITESSNLGHGICCNPTDNSTKCGFYDNE